MSTEKSIHRINELLVAMVLDIKTANSMGLFDKNRIAEDVLIPLFSNIYDYKNLENLNVLGENYEGIDLADKVSRVAFQISSNINNQKIKDTLTSIVKKEYFKDYDSFKFYDITEKQGSYSGAGWSEIIDNKFNFSENDILDYSDLAKNIRHLSPEKIKKIEEYLETQYGAKYPNKKLPSAVPLIKGFIGRNEYLAQLLDWYKAGHQAFVLHGFGGIGKSAIAIKFANEIKNDFDAHLFISLQTNNQLTANDLIFQIVSQFIPDLKAEIEFDEIYRTYVSLMNTHKTLIVLDNIKDRNVVEPLNQTQACIIATSRESFILSGGKSILVDSMTSTDAVELLFSIAEKERFEGKAEDLAYLAGYVPMALLPLASILAENEMEDASDLLQKYQDRKNRLALADPNRGNLTVYASFDLSYEQLTPELQKLWRELVIFPADFNEFAAVSIWNLLNESQKGLEVLKSLTKLNLLKGDRSTKRYKLHDLTRDFLREKITDSEFNELKFNFSKHYLAVLDNAEYISEKNDFKSSLIWLDVDSTNILLGQEWAANNIHINDEVAKICLAYATVAFNYIRLRLYPKDLIAWQKAGLEASKKIKNSEAQVSCLSYMGVGLLAISHYQQAIDCFEEAKSIASYIGNERKVNDILSYLSSAYKGLGKITKAIELGEESLSVAHKINSAPTVFRALSNLVPLYRIVGEYDKSIEYSEKALEIAKSDGLIQSEGVILANLGSTYFEKSDYENAQKYYLEALEIAQEIGDRQGEAHRSGNLGNVYDNLEKLDKSREFHEKALAIHKEMGDRRGEAGDLGNIASLLIKSGQVSEAIKYFEEALQIGQDISDLQVQAIQHGNLGISYAQIGEVEKARKNLLKAINIYNSFKSPLAERYRQLLTYFPE